MRASPLNVDDPVNPPTDLLLEHCFDCVHEEVNRDGLIDALVSTCKNAFDEICEARGQSTLGLDFELDVIQFTPAIGNVCFDLDVTLTSVYEQSPDQHRHALWESAVYEKLNTKAALCALYDDDVRWVESKYTVVQFSEHEFRILSTYGFLSSPEETRRLRGVCASHGSGLGGRMRACDWDRYNDDVSTHVAR